MIEVKDISKKFGSTRALDQVSFQIEDGEIVGLLGPNGAGKTTAMRVMSSLYAPDDGSVAIEGYDTVEESLKSRALIGYMPENNPLYVDMMVIDFLKQVCSFRNLPKSEWISHIRFAVKSAVLGDVLDRPIRTLSKGYKQRVGIASVLVGKPKILILDEPTEGLDPNQRDEIRDLIKSLSKNHTIVLSTHVLSEVTAICSRVIIINKGVIAADGSTKSILKQSKQAHRYTVVIEGEALDKQLMKLEQVQEVEMKKLKAKGRYKYEILVDRKFKLQPDLAKIVKKSDAVIWKLEESKPTLESAFRNLTHDQSNLEDN